MTLEESVGEFIEEKRSYFEKWIYNEPIIISKSHNIKLERLQKIMYKLIQEFVTNYSKYKHLMPVEENIENIIRVFNEKKLSLINKDQEMRDVFFSSVQTIAKDLDIILEQNMQQMIKDIVKLLEIQSQSIQSTLNVNG